MNSWDFDDPALQTLQRPDGSYHTPVMAEEIVALLRPAPGMIFLDGTAGGGGHTEKLLQYGAEVIALDQDADAIARCQQRLAAYASRLHLCEANFEEADDVLDQLNVRSLGGALLDLGVSSYQLDTASRGFAMMKDGPLDMRMSRQKSAHRGRYRQHGRGRRASPHFSRIWRGTARDAYRCSHHCTPRAAPDSHDV